MKIKKGKSKKISLKYKIILIILFVVIDVFLIYSFIKINDTLSFRKLNNEYNELLKVDFTTNKYNNNIESNGRYVNVEKAIKEYFSLYSKKTQEVLDIISDERFVSILSVEEYQKGNLEDSIDYIVKTREDINKKIDYLVSYNSLENVNKYIKDNSSNDFEKELLKSYLLTDKTLDYFEDSNNLLQNKQIEINNILDTSRDIYYFLVVNNGKWLIKDGQIQFANTSLQAQYDAYIKKIK